MNIWQSEIGSMPKNKAFMTAKKDVCMCLLNTFSVFPDPNFSIISWGGKCQEFYGDRRKHNVKIKLI